MNFHNAPREQRNGGTFLTKEAEDHLIRELITEHKDLLARLKGQ